MTHNINLIQLRHYTEQILLDLFQQYVEINLKPVFSSLMATMKHTI